MSRSDILSFANFKRKYKIELNPQQERAVRKTDGPALLLAVPGSGKTTVITTRVAYLMYCKGVPPERILTLTFSRAAAAEMKERFLQRFGETGAAAQARFSTIHSFCYWVIRKHAIRYGYSIPELITDNSQLIRKLCLNVYHQKADDVAVKELAQYIGFCKNRIIDPIQLEDVRFDDLNFRRLYEAYEDTLRQNGLMDFDDQLRMVEELTANYPDILKELQLKYIYINIDEAQDNSHLQHRIIRKLSSAPHQRLFMVGDEDQSIYGFRAAYPEALISFRQEHADAEILFIETNYRCCAPVAATAKRIISQNHSRYQKDMKTVHESGSVRQKKLSDSEKQYRYLLGELKKLSASGKRVAVLYRNNSSGIPIFDMLYREGLSFAGYIDAEYFRHRVVRDFVYALRLATNPGDIDAYSKIYWKLGLNTTKTQYTKVAAYLMRRGTGDIFQLLSDTYEGIHRVDILHFGEDMELIGEMQPYNAVEELSRLFYRSWISLQVKRGLESVTAIEERLFALLALASAQNNIKDLLKRMKWLEAVCDKGRQRIQPEPITVATIHQSKGMEFDKVFIIDLFRGVFPSENSAGVFSLYGGDVYEEEIRLLYVAITRARYDVEIITSHRRFGRERELSPFVDLVFGSSYETKRSSSLSGAVTGSGLGSKIGSEYSEAPRQSKLSISSQLAEVEQKFPAGIASNPQTLWCGQNNKPYRRYTLDTV